MSFSPSTRAFFAFSSLLGLVGCASTVVGTQAAGTTSGTSSSGGTGGSSTSSVTTSVSTGSTATSTVGSTSSGGTGGGGCGTLTITVDHGTPTTLTTNCPGTSFNQSATTAVGWYSANPTQMVLGLSIIACAADDASAEGVDLELSDGVMGPHEYVSGSATFSTGQGSSWTNEEGKAVLPIQVDVTASGASIVGTFQLTVADSSQNQHQLFGSFDVCHGSDFLPP